MPIIGLTDGTPSFKEIGRLRKGAPKAQGLKDLDYLRADFRPDEPEAFARFITAYSDQPTQINVRLAFPELAASWDANWEVYNTGGMLGKADGRRWVYLRSHKTGVLLVKDGVPQDDSGLPVDENGLPYMPFDPATPVYTYWSQKKGEEVPVYPKMTGKLKVLIPELRIAAFMIAITHSVYDVYQLNSQLMGIALAARNITMPLPMVPLVLSRRRQMVSSTYGGKKHLEEKSLLNIEIRQDWAEAQFRLLDSILPGVVLPAPGQVLELPIHLQTANVEEGEEENDLPGTNFQSLRAESSEESVGSVAQPTLLAYVDGGLVDLSNQAEVEAFTAYTKARKQQPFSRGALRDWARENKNDRGDSNKPPVV